MSEDPEIYLVSPKDIEEPWIYQVPTEDGGVLNLTVTKPSDPAYALLLDDHTSTPNMDIYRDNCYICRDPEFAQMGMPLCFACEVCKTGHIAADDTICDSCGADAYELYLQAQVDMIKVEE